MINLAVAGAAGRMGQAVIQASSGDPRVRICCALERTGARSIGMDAGEVAGVDRLNVPIDDRLSTCDYDVLIEFTTPEATLEHARTCRALGKRMVIGTTGLSAEEKAEISAIAADIAVIMAPNMSIGVNLCFRLVELAARTLGEEVDIEIVEAHHRHKVDAPSGTALRLGEAAAAALGRDLSDVAVYGRQGPVGPRDRRTIGFATIRAGDIIGEHSVMFAGEGERVEISHRSSSRINFAGGALRAAVWSMGQESGLYDMQDVLDLR